MRRLALLAVALAAPAAAQPSPEVRAEVTAVAADGQTRLEVRLMSAAQAGRVASFQGLMRLPAGAGRVTAGEFASGIVGAWNEAEPGRVRFAGVAVEGVADARVLVLTVPGTVAGAEVLLEEAVGTDGFRKLSVGRPGPAQPLEE